MQRNAHIALAMAGAILGTIAVGLGGYWYGDAIVRLDPGDPSNFDSPAEANDPVMQRAMHDERAGRVQWGFVAVTVGAALIAVAAVMAALAPPREHTHRHLAK